MFLVTVVVGFAEGLWILGCIGLGELGKASDQGSGKNTRKLVGTLLSGAQNGELGVSRASPQQVLDAGPVQLGGDGEPPETLGHSCCKDLGGRPGATVRAAGNKEPSTHLRSRREVVRATPEGLH